MKSCCAWLPEAIAIAGVGIGVGIALQGWPQWSNSESQAWASWVQAVGSVIAIGVAIWLRQRDVADARELRKAEQLARMQAALAIVTPLPKWMSKRVAAFRKTADDVEKRQVAEDIVRQALSVLRGISEIPIHESPYTFLATHLLNAKFCVDRYIHSFERIVSAMEHPAQDGLDAALVTAEETVRLMKKTLAETKTAASRFDGETLKPAES